MRERGRAPGGGETGWRMRERITLTGANQGARRELLRNTAARTVCLNDKRRLRLRRGRRSLRRKFRSKIDYCRRPRRRPQE
ncbi:hypothetical protein FU139_25730 [Burkholderia territorii]|nr:hypothetical protein FU139_25730 [Burkholderia territorii]